MGCRELAVVTLAVAVPRQPSASLTVTVYKPLWLTLMEAPDWLFDQEMLLKALFTESVTVLFPQI